MFKKILDKIFGKNHKTEEKTPKFSNKAKLKQGGYAIAITAIVVAVAVAFNILFAVLAQRVNLDIDISLTGDNTLSEENIKFIKELDEKVTITVCITREDFSTGAEYVAQNYFSATDATGSNDGVYAYYDQTLNLLDLYDVYSDNITINFVDPYDPSFSEITNKYKGVTLCDIIVECEKEIGGEKYTKNEILSFDDIYYLTEDENSYAGMFGGDYKSYTVSGNKMESALTSAIFKATSNETQKVLVLENHTKKGNITEYIDFLKQNNFDVEVFSDYNITEISEEVDLVIISEPTEDFASEELDVIDEWLKNGEKRGKGLMFFADPTSPETPNLASYLEEWGIAIEPGLLYETSENYQVFGDPTVNYFVPSTIESEDDITKEYAEIMNGGYAIAGGNAPLLQVFEEEGIRITTPLAVTPEDTVVIKPISEDSEWKPDGSIDTNQYIGVLMASESTYVDNVLCTSYVCAFSSRDFIDPYWFSTGYDVNSELILNSAKHISGADTEGVTFTMKKMSDTTFTNVVTYDSTIVIMVIFQWLLPFSLIITGVVVFIRRARR
ncbi:MAG: GldG family protein [Clostridia bacterium]|nr:GldG family protein [Clostridia bacterium]